MSEWQLTSTSVLFAWIGLAALCFQSANQRQRLRLGKQSLQVRAMFVVTGLLLLVASYQGAIAAHGFGFGSLVYISQLGLIGLLLILVVSYSTRAAYFCTLVATMAIAGLALPMV